MIKHLFCDLDGTLIKDFHYIDEEDIKALKMACEKGVSVSIATGRLDYEIKMIMDQYQFKGFRISQNGGVVFNESNQLLYENCLGKDDVRLILNVLKNQPVITFYQTALQYMVEEKLPFIIEFERNQSYITYHENKNILNEIDLHEIVTISLWAEKDVNVIVKKHLDKLLPPHLTSYISSQYTLDITRRENSKGNAIKKICQLNQIGLNEIAVIGDSYNDVSMFMLTHHSYVMEEADVEVKKYAKRTIKSVKEAAYHLIK